MKVIRNRAQWRLWLDAEQALCSNSFARKLDLFRWKPRAYPVLAQMIVTKNGFREPSYFYKDDLLGWLTGMTDPQPRARSC